MNEFSNQFGASRCARVTEGTVTGTVKAIYAHADTVINAIVGANGYVITGWTGATLPAGQVLYGEYSSVQVTGDCSIYHNSF